MSSSEVIGPISLSGPLKWTVKIPQEDSCSANVMSFISLCLQCMCEHEFNLVVLMPVKPLHVLEESRHLLLRPIHTERVYVRRHVTPLWPAFPFIRVPSLLRPSIYQPTCCTTSANIATRRWHCHNNVDDIDTTVSRAVCQNGLSRVSHAHITVTRVTVRWPWPSVWWSRSTNCYTSSVDLRQQRRFVSMQPHSSI